jgi:hypothetical protein
MVHQVCQHLQQMQQNPWEAEQQRQGVERLSQHLVEARWYLRLGEGSPMQDADQQHYSVQAYLKK